MMMMMMMMMMMTMTMIKIIIIICADSGLLCFGSGMVHREDEISSLELALVGVLNLSFKL
jgi:hypothetical protein